MSGFYHGLEGFAEDPITEENGKWYFWNETWTDLIGPYETKEEAIVELAKYVTEYLT